MNSAQEEMEAEMKTNKEKIDRWIPSPPESMSSKKRREPE
jgi:hypothetical protein